ncbi:MAG TPA: type II toxin-antitoxin system HicA family toxin [Spirochaetota bacterium]|nr:type II toxin-antitoxin system HicA family toxin [Spirochaetota bacterium]
MSQFEKLLNKILTGRHDKNIEFQELCGVLQRLGFSERIKGDHHIYYKDNVVEIINIQPLGSKAKPYQVKQVRNVITKYKLGDDDEQA